jgi:putative MATE family efflux protein
VAPLSDLHPYCNRTRPALEGWSFDRMLLRRMLVFLWPLLLSNALQSVGVTINGIYVDQLLGTPAYAVMSVVLSVMFFCVSFGIAVSAATSILAAKAWGEKDLELLRSVAQTSLTLAAGVGIAIAMAGVAIAIFFVDKFQIPGMAEPAAVIYASVLFMSLPVQFVAMTAAALLRSTGASAAPMKATAVALAVTVVCSPAAILALDGRQLGIVGAALALLAAQLSSLAWTMRYIKKSKHVLSNVFGGVWSIDAILFKPIIQMGLPVSLFFIAGSLADLALLSLVTPHGTVAAASWGAARQVMIYVQLPAMSIAILASTFTAQAIGSRELNQVRKIVTAALLLNMTLSGFLACAVIVGGPVLVSAFVSDGQVTSMSSTILQITALGTVAFGMSSVLTSVMRAEGHILAPTCISLACLLLLMYPMSYILHAIFGLFGIWMAYPITHCSTLLLQWLAFSRRPYS